MRRISTQNLAYYGLMIAIVFCVTYLPFLHVPSPISQGYYNVGDAAVLIAAILLGKNGGLIAGAFGSALADIALGGYIFAPVTLIVKGVEGYVAGFIAERGESGKRGNLFPLLAVIVGPLIMVAGYFLAESTVLGWVDSELGLAAAVAEMPGNLVQGLLSAIIAYVITTPLLKTRVFKTTRN